MPGEKKYIVFFDLDRTLASMNSGHALMKTAGETGLVGRKEIAQAVFQSLLYKTGIISTPAMIENMGRWLRGARREKVAAMAQKSVENYLIPSVYRQASDEIMRHKERNAYTALLSSAIEEICSPVAKHLGLDAVLCSTMETDNGKYTGRPSGKYCYGNEKAERINTICNEMGFSPDDAWCYGDSVSDIAALSLVGKPVCINPDPGLKKHAVKKGWTVVMWSHRKI